MEARTVQVILELERWMSGVEDALALPKEAAEFVHALILATNAKHALEIGTSYGYSGLWIASALGENGGKLITIDRDPRKLDAARKAFASAGLLESIDLRAGSALDILPSLTGPFDFVLNDADKANCRRYVESLLDRLSDRALILTDNTRTHATELAEFVRWMRARADFVSVGIPIGNGMELSVKRRGDAVP